MPFRLTLLRIGLTGLVSLEALTSLAQPSPVPQAKSGPSPLISELGCANCHTDLKVASTLKERTPDLSFAGLRYNPAYLLEYLQSPVNVRRHLGHSRMPDFHLDQREALALVTFLQTQKRIPPQSPEFPGELVNQAADQAISRSQFQTELTNGLICLTCHIFEGKGGVQGVELANISYRLQKEWVKKYLAAPSLFGVPPTTMPAQFYQLPASGKVLQELISNPAGKINLVADFLFSLNHEKRTALDQNLKAARSSFPNVTGALGEQIFRSQNCAACHRHDTIQPPVKDAAPDLAQEGSRVHRPWLESYLKHPVAIRPFGFHPGEGSRMPDFRLSGDESAELASFLSASGGPSGDFHSKKVSAFSMKKLESLMTEKFSCLGCHRLGDKGGRIGPDLTGVGARLQPQQIYNTIKNPRSKNPHTVMPKLPLSDETVQQITNYLLQRQEPGREDKYLSLTENSLIPFGAADPNQTADSLKNYRTYCASCHGAAGQGDGFNAKFLTTKPTVHADRSYTAMRPDDTLYDGISSGGYILNKSHQMPAWGETLSSQDIRGLVGYIRTLCQCQGPSWSLDNVSRR